MTKDLIITGSNIYDITSFYSEINRVFMHNENWKIGESLDAFDDLLYGGFGAINNSQTVKIIWTDIALSRKALGYETTKTYYLNKLQPGSPFNKQHFTAKLKELEAGGGETYFDVVIKILSEHSNIILVTD